MISSTSRYANHPIVLVSTSRGSVVTIARKPPTPVVIQYTFIRVEQGARVDHMGKAAFGDERLWWKIADANPEILDWTDLPVGTILRIPSA